MIRNMALTARSAPTRSAPEPLAAADCVVGDPVHVMRQLFAEHDLPGSPERAALAGTLERASRSVHSDIEAALRPFDLSRSRFQLLHQLHLRPEGTQLGKLSGLLFVQPATVTSLVDRLVASGLVERIEVAGDRRATVARITKHGNEVVQAAFQKLADEEFGLGHLSVDEADTLRTLLVKAMGTRR